MLPLAAIVAIMALTVALILLVHHWCIHKEYSGAKRWFQSQDVQSRNMDPCHGGSCAGGSDWGVWAHGVREDVGEDAGEDVEGSPR
jgi:hypothetical protein